MHYQINPHFLFNTLSSMALQKEYLNIEKERFSDRMIVRVDIPAECP
ncbi:MULTISPECIES: histidine kinase [unclassified Shinella]|nr:histidine kinase [Shinella sp. YE25]